jgi:small subunit ribosomal protein S9
MTKEAEKVKKEKKPAAPLKRKVAVAKLKTPAVPKAEAKAGGKFFEGVGRRKTAVARARLFPNGEDVFLVNGKPYKEYFSTPFLQKVVSVALDEIKYPGVLGVSILVRGGGKGGQAEAARLGISRALVKLLPESYKVLRKLGYLTRDPRMRERKKPGLKRARKAPQWQKR